MLFALKFLVVMLLIGLSSACGVRYMEYARTGMAFKAANWGVLIIALNQLSFLSWMSDKWLLPAVYIGDWVGTYLIVKRQKP